MSVLAGNVVKMQATFKDAEGTKRDPATVQVRRLQPGQVTPDTYTYGVDDEVVRSGVGVYYILNDTTDLPGTWKFVWNSSGTYQAAGQKEFVVENDILA